MLWPQEPLEVGHNSYIYENLEALCCPRKPSSSLILVAVLIKWQNKAQIDHMYIILSIAALGDAFALLQLIHAQKLQNASARWQDTPLQLEHSALP